MAISKTQPMRSAEIQIVDALNSQTYDISTLKEQGNSNAQNIASLQSQIGDGFNDSSVTQKYGAMSSAIQSISDELGDGFDDKTTVSTIVYAQAGEISNLHKFTDKFRIGSVSVTVPGNDSASSSVNFQIPYAENDKCIVIPQVSTEELLSLFEVTLIDCTYSGFSYSISNSDADEHTVTLGYVAVKVN